MHKFTFFEIFSSFFLLCDFHLQLRIRNRRDDDFDSNE